MSAEKMRQAYELYKAKRYQEAFDIWSQLTDNGTAQYNAAVLLYNQLIPTDDIWGKTYDLLYKAYQKGEKRATFFCGYLVEKRKVDVDIEAAVFYYKHCSEEETRAFDGIKRLAAQNNASAQGLLAFWYYCGFHTDADFDEAVKWASKAYEKGEKCYSSFILGCKKDRDGDEEGAFKYFLEAGNAGNWKTYYTIAKHYYDVLNYPEAIRWYQKGAERGLQGCIFHLGRMYLCGLGCKQNKERAVQLFERIISSKDPDPVHLFNIGLLYYYGDGGTPDTFDIVGLDKNPDLAIELWKRSSELGCTMASAELATAYYWGESVPLDYNLAFEYAKKTGDRPYGRYVLALCYYFGHGCKKDDELARESFVFASDHGYREADKFLLKGKALKPYSEWRLETNGAEVLGALAESVVSSIISGGND